MKCLPKILLPLFFAATISSAVPTEINYQGRLTDGDGNPASGSKVFGLKIYDAAIGGNELYSETIGSVVVDDNGVYNFQFGAGGSSTVSVSETLALTDGSSTTFQGTPASSPIAGTLSVSDGTYNWNEVDGNPGEQVTANATVVNGFVVGINVTNGGSGYTTPPVVTITGNGAGATATAIVADGSVSSISVDTTGSGYTEATVTIEEPPAPFVVDYSEENLTFTYASAPASGTEIVASYQASENSILGALQQASNHWLELSVNGGIQSSRERILSVPFAQYSGASSTLNKGGSVLVLDGEGLPIVSGYNGWTSIGMNNANWGLWEKTFVYKIQGFPFASLSGIKIKAREISESGQYYGNLTASLTEYNINTRLTTKIAEVYTDVNSETEISISLLEPGTTLDFSANTYRLNLKVRHARLSYGGTPEDTIYVDAVLLDYAFE